MVLLKDLVLYDNKSWNDPRDFAKPVKAISLPQDVPSTSDCHLIELEHQVQRLMEAYISPMQPTQVNKITFSCEICSGPHDTQYCMENPEQAFAITDRIVGALPSDTVKNLKLNVHSTSLVLSARSYPTFDPQCSSHPYNSINAVKNSRSPSSCSNEQCNSGQIHRELRARQKWVRIHPGEMPIKIEDPTLFTQPCRLGNSEPFDTLADLGACVNLIPLYLFKKLNIGLSEETNHVFGLADGTKSYPIGIVRDVEVHIGRLKLLTDFYVIDMKKDLETPLLVGREFLATANAVIDCRKTKIPVGEGITRSVFGVKGIELGQEEAPY
ncbi:MAK10-like protein [Tanacetum coccineum]